jgi:hypothetical protein
MATKPLQPALASFPIFFERKTWEQLAKLYDDWGRAAEAAECRNEIAKLEQK